MKTGVTVKSKANHVLFSFDITWIRTTVSTEPYTALRILDKSTHEMFSTTPRIQRFWLNSAVAECQFSFNVRHCYTLNNNSNVTQELNQIFIALIADLHLQTASKPYVPKTKNKLPITIKSVSLLFFILQLIRHGPSLCHNILAQFGYKIRKKLLNSVKFNFQWTKQMTTCMHKLNASKSETLTPRFSKFKIPWHR